MAACPVCGTPNHCCGPAYAGKEEPIREITKLGGPNLVEVEREVRPGVWATFQVLPEEA